MKRYILTDPCYLINDEFAWRRYCDMIFDEKGYMSVDNGAAFIAEQLGTTVQVAGTGYGDWTNSLACVKGTNRLNNDGCFCADAGMVCFCELTPQVERALRDLGPGSRRLRRRIRCANLIALTATGPGLRLPTAPAFTCRRSVTFSMMRTTING